MLLLWFLFCYLYDWKLRILFFLVEWLFIIFNQCSSYKTNRRSFTIIANSLVKFFDRTPNFDNRRALKNRRLTSDVQINLFTRIVLNEGRIFNGYNGLCTRTDLVARARIAFLLGPRFRRWTLSLRARLLVTLGHHLLACHFALLHSTPASFRTLQEIVKLQRNNKIPEMGIKAMNSWSFLLLFVSRIFRRNANKDKRTCQTNYTFPHSPVFQETGQSQTLQYCLSTGTGCGHIWPGTTTVFPAPRVTSWMQLTSRVWIPNPQELLQLEKSLVFHLANVDTN